MDTLKTLSLTGGAMAAAIRDKDWSKTILGPIGAWPHGLGAVVTMTIANGFPMIVLWGPDLIQIYNDGYRRVMGDRHPAGLGQPTRECWPEAWHINEPIYARVLTGETVRHEDAPYRIARDGGIEDCRFSLSCSPLLDDAGAIGGVMAVLIETTARMTSERAEAALALRESEEFNRMVLASTADCIKVLDLDGNLVFMSENGQRVMEVGNFAAIRGCPWPDFWKDHENIKAKAALAAAQAGGIGHFQGYADTMAGTAKFWDVQVTAILGVDGRPEKILSVSRDITAARLAEHALHEAEGLNAAMLSSSRDCIVLLDPEGHTIYVSPGGIEAMEITGAPELGLSWMRVWHGDDLIAAQQALAAARAGGVGRFQGYCPTFKNTPKWWDIVISPLPEDDGEPVRLLSVGRDITDQKALESELRHVNANLEQRVVERTADRNRLWQLSADIMLVARFDGRVTAVNPAWKATLGWDQHELVDGNFMDLIHPEDLDRTGSANEDLSRGESINMFENRYRHKDGSYRWISWTAVPGEAFINAVGRDITAEREKAEALRLTEDALRQSQKMEAVGQLTGGLAHDFNNLLTGVTGSLELLQTRISQGRLQEIDRYVNSAQDAAKRASALTHRLLAFSRRQTLDPKPTNANRLVIGMAELIRRTVGPEIELEVAAAAGLWNILADPGQLENALLNLCINARDAMPQGGKITIETNNRWIDHRAAKDQDVAPGQYISLCVSDNGTGMPPAVIARAFDPFYTTKPIGQGTGLGLSMIYGFVRQSGGQARIYSEPGQGAMVCLYLPRYIGETEEAALTSDLSEAPRAEAGQTVLVVDDEPTVRMLVAEVLQDLGYTAIEAKDGASGLKVLQSNVRLDLLVTDVGLPGGLNGRQMADAARSLRPGLKVLFITGYAENAVLSHNHLEAGMHVLTKPFALEMLATRIKDLIDN